MKHTLVIPLFLVFLPPSIGLADSRNASHAGQMDTDGILSPGELRNPNINYDRAQEWGERRGDERYNNRDNNDAARDEERRREKREREERAQYDWQHQYYRDGPQAERRENERREHDRRNDSWWDW